MKPCLSTYFLVQIISFYWLIYTELWIQFLWLWDMLYMQNAPIIIHWIYFVPKANEDKLPIVIISYIQVSVLDTIEFLHTV